MFFKTVHKTSGAHPASHSMRAEVFLSRVKRSEPEVEHLSPSSAEIKNEWSYTPSPPIICGN
jgi:hypothetical protein